jgi:alkyldihydroxyacetonephosphate synthase
MVSTMAKKSGFQPDWYEKAPPPGSYRSIFKWGDPAVFKHPNRKLYELMKERLGLTDEDFRTKVDVGEEQVSLDIPVRLPARFLEKLRGIVGPENVKTDDYARLQVALGKTMLDLIRLRKKTVDHAPDAVVIPRSQQDIRSIVRLCHREKIPVTVYGGGSSVTRGVECVKGGLSLDMRPFMKRIVRLSAVNQTVTVEPGLLGPALEEALNDAPRRFGTKLRYTCGHFPQSFEYSSVGGWVVTRGAGQNSTYYGKIEDLVLAQQFVTPAGDILTKEVPAAAVGPDLDQVMIGSEGAFGILVSATLRIFRHMPDSTRRFSFMFKDWERAVEAAREVMQSECGRPSVFRLSDPEETDVALHLYGADAGVVDATLRLRGYKRGRRCLLLGSADGDPAYARLVEGKVHEVAGDHGAMSTTGLVTRAWEKGRFKDPYMREDLQDYGIIIDTLECAASWETVPRVWEGVRAYVHGRPGRVCMSHMSHLYPQGANLYFIFITKPGSVEEYLDLQGGILDQIRKSGAAMSHHHGIGKMIAPWLEGAIGRNELAVLRALKRHFDPRSVMNPGGTLALDLPGRQRR